LAHFVSSIKVGDALFCCLLSHADEVPRWRARLGNPIQIQQ
jgi:hypothetical protein